MSYLSNFLDLISPFIKNFLPRPNIEIIEKTDTLFGKELEIYITNTGKKEFCINKLYIKKDSKHIDSFNYHHNILKYDDPICIKPNSYISVAYFCSFEKSFKKDILKSIEIEASISNSIISKDYNFNEINKLSEDDNILL